ncbi:MAG TPA: PilN domain-containing protein [Stellaceae bacterium]|nr:PilN domain-containing protein [Stellaceae bacterium]
MISQLRLGSSIGAAWGWWLGELVALVPAGLRRWFGGMHGRHVLLIDGSGGALAYETGARREVLGRIDGPAGSERAGRRSSRRQQTMIRLPTEYGLRTTLTLPLAASVNLAQVVGFEIERQTPFKPRDIYFAHRIAARDAKAKNLIVELAVAPRTIVDEALRLAEAHGIQVAGVELAATGTALAASPNLLPDRQRAAGQGPFRVILALLAAATVALAVAAAAIPLLRIEAAATDLARRVADAKHRAEAGLKLQKDIEETLQDAQFLVQRKRQTASVSELLDALTRLLPDDTWLSELQITVSDVQLSGYAVSATALLSRLDETVGFSNAAFRASVTQDSKQNREQFDIAAKIKPRPAQ